MVLKSLWEGSWQMAWVRFSWAVSGIPLSSKFVFYQWTMLIVNALVRAGQDPTIVSLLC